MLYIHRCQIPPTCARLHRMLPAMRGLEGNSLRGSQVDYRRKGSVQKHQRIWKFFQSRKASSIVANVGMITLLGTLVVGPGQSAQVKRARAQPSIGCTVCATSQLTEDTNIYPRVRLRWIPSRIATKKVIAHPAVVTDSPVTTTPVHATPTANPPAHTGTPAPTPVPPGPNPGVNVFPYPSCTWWADQRYYQLHGIFVPWHTQANAWQWTARAYQYGWHVSNSPVVGAIVNLQPGVQGASGLGHVAVVERILSNGHVIASNMSWGAYPYQVTDVEFTPGSGVTFIWQ